MKSDFDLGIIGAGFAGSLLAMAARRLGRSVVMIERGKHPRFAIGESSTPLANLLLEELARRYDLPDLLPLAEWGSWQRRYPAIACGLKRGFTFFRHAPPEAFSDTDAHANQLLVAASPDDEVADTHWYRPDFDQWLVARAQALGAEYLDQTDLDPPGFPEAGCALTGRRAGCQVKVNVRMLVDASGPRGYLHRQLRLLERSLQYLPPTRGLFTHFRGVQRWDDAFPARGTPPYAVDDAAVHHIFEGGWIWVLRFNNGITSAGVAATDALAHELQLGNGTGLGAWHRLLQRLPSVAKLFAQAEAVHPFIYAPRLSFFSAQATGPGWVMLPSAAGVVDPLLSTGFPLTLLGILRLCRIIENHWGSPNLSAALADYARATLDELATTEKLVGALYRHLGNFEVFKRLSLLYFAAASFTEASWRLGRREFLGGFLLTQHPAFAPQFHACLELAHQSPPGATNARLLDLIERTIEPIDIAGFRDRKRKDWYPVDFEDLYRAAPKLGVSEDEVRKRGTFNDHARTGTTDCRARFR